MAFDREIEAFIKNFAKDLEEGHVAIFAGAGMSKAIGYVNWPELLNDIADELGLNVNKEHDLISLAQYHVTFKGNNSGLAKKILQEFSDQAEESDTHKILARLPIPTFWTTNYDNVIERALENALKVVDIKHSVAQLSDAKPKRDVVVYKMHGDVTIPREAVISKEQYENYHRDHEGFITALSADLLSKTFLFIGFSFTDPNLDYVLSRLRLSAPVRDHYCFMKKEVRLPEDDDEIFRYKTRKQELKVLDLKRYKIQTLLIDDYNSIPVVLTEIERRFRKKTIFISGSAEEYGAFGKQSALAFVHSLSKKIISLNFRVVNGFGWGVGSAVINGALEAIYENPKRLSEDQLIIKPFPQFETSQKKLPQLWEEYRQRMISLAGIAIFVYGNKRDENGEIIAANGVTREFEIALQHGLIPIPIGATGYVSQELWKAARPEIEDRFNSVPKLIALYDQLGDENKSPESLLEVIIEMLKELQK